MKEVQAEVDAIYAKIKSVGEYEGGIMLWPVEGYQTVTSDYGWRFGGTDFHTGIDIARLNARGEGIYGKPIRAASDGTVVFTQTTYTYGRGYGIYLIIDHGGGISTLYGHTCGLNVKLGDKVKRGRPSPSSAQPAGPPVRICTSRSASTARTPIPGPTCDKNIRKGAFDE